MAEVGETAVVDKDVSKLNVDAPYEPGAGFVMPATVRDKPVELLETEQLPPPRAIVIEFDDVVADETLQLSLVKAVPSVMSEVGDEGKPNDELKVTVMVLPLTSRQLLPQLLNPIVKVELDPAVVGETENVTLETWEANADVIPRIARATVPSMATMAPSPTRRLHPIRRVRAVLSAWRVSEVRITSIRSRSGSRRSGA